MGNSAKRDVKHAASSEDTAKALDLRRVGRTYREVAAELGRSVGWVHWAIKTYIDEHPAPNVDAYRAEVLERQAGIIDMHWPLRADPESAKVIQAADKIIMSVTGAESRREIDLSGSLAITQESNDQLLDRLARLAASAAAGEGDTEPEPD